MKIGDYAIHKSNIAGTVVEVGKDNITLAYPKVLPKEDMRACHQIGNVKFTLEFLEAPMTDFQKIGWQKFKEVKK